MSTSEIDVLPECGCWTDQPCTTEQVVSDNLHSAPLHAATCDCDACNAQYGARSTKLISHRLMHTANGPTCETTYQQAAIGLPSSSQAVRGVGVERQTTGKTKAVGLEFLPHQLVDHNVHPASWLVEYLDYLLTTYSQIGARTDMEQTRRTFADMIRHVCEQIQSTVTPVGVDPGGPTE